MINQSINIRLLQCDKMQANNGLMTERALDAELLVRDANRPEPMSHGHIRVYK